jgi:type II secretory pathway pseudopilin PulG
MRGCWLTGARERAERPVAGARERAEQHAAATRERAEQHATGTRGSALVWALVATLVLLIVVGILAAVVTFSLRQTTISQVETQAYYTARSVSERITGWLSGSPVVTIGIPTEQQQFISNLANGPAHEEYSEADLGGDMGRAEVDISINAAHDLITIVATGFFGDQTETVTSTLALAFGSGGYSYQDIDFPQSTTSDFATRPGGLPYYEQRETQLNARQRDANPAIVGNETSANAPKYDDNKLDLPTANGVDSPGEELTWRNRDTGTDAILGTASSDAGKHDVADERMFVTPKNGRWTINPLQEGSTGTAGSSPSSKETAANNTRLISLSMRDYSGKDLEIRLGGYNIGSGNSSLKNSANYYNSLLMFDFADNKNTAMPEKPNPFVEYYDDNIFTDTAKQYWHPQNWRSMTIYTQRTTDTTVNNGVAARLVFGPFTHKHYSVSGYLSYYNSMQYVGNPHYGQSAGKCKLAFPTSSSTSAYMGMSHFPVYYGEGFGMFFLDDSDKDVLLLQGMNMLGTPENPSMVYSYRGVQIGGGLVKSANAALEGRTTRNVNTDIHGMDTHAAATHINYYATTARYSQIFYDTDIVLRTPNGTGSPRQSRILDATLPNDGVYANNNNYSDANNTKFSPTVRIIGGDIYVGAGQTLTIDGGRINSLNTKAGSAVHEGQTITLGTSAGEYTQVVAPDAITVAEGGTLVIRGRYDAAGTTWLASSAYANVNAPIYVEGTLNIEEGARLTNQIFCYGTGVINIVEKPSSPTATAVVTLERRSIYEGAHDGIHVFDGGILNVEENASLTLRGAQVYVGVDTAGGKNVGIMNIKKQASIAGDVCVLGILNIDGNFTLEPDPTGYVDDISTPHTDESDSTTHGIFVYHDTTIGSGTLNISSEVNQIWGKNSGRIHSFGGYPSITDKVRADAIFCNNRNETDNTCEHWFTPGGYWMSQGMTPGSP